MSEQKFFNSKDAAVLINTYGFALFPVQGFVNGICTCGHMNCTSPGKHPASTEDYKDGFKSATKDKEALGKLWAGRKGLNVGVATGAPSGMFVVDIDSTEGEAALAALGTLPDTLTVKTGKGRHLYFKWPGEEIITVRGVFPGVDIRGDGGYVCGVGTNHYSGAVYQWENPLEQIADAPQFILDIALKRLQPKHIPVPLNIKKGGLSLGFSEGWTVDKAYELLSFINPDCGYDEWIAVGMGLQAEGFSFDVWDKWSQSGNKYNAHGMVAHWKSFKPGAGRTFGTVVKMAQDGGWKPANKNDYQPLKIPPTPPLVDTDTIDPETGEIIASPEYREFGLVYADEIRPTLETADFVEGMLCEKQFSVIYGESNCGKTFFMLDLAMHVALGREWRGKAVEQGAVIYAALEGGHGTRNRICAFREHFCINDSIPLAVIPSTINFLDPQGDILTLVAAIAKAQARLGKVKLVVIDTLARAISGGDENSSVDMGQLVGNADYIRAVTGAHIAFIHHSGKDAVKGARGHSSLRAAVDTEIEISRPDTESPSTIKIVKQREMEMIEEMAFRLERVVLGENQRGNEVTSCVVMPAELIEHTREFVMNPLQTFIYEALIEAMIRHASDRNIYPGQAPVRCVGYDDLRVVMEERGFKEFMATEKKTTAEQIKSATQTARLALKKAQKINFNKNHIWPIYDNE